MIMIVLGLLSLGFGLVGLVADIGDDRATATVESCHRTAWTRTSKHRSRGWRCWVRWTSADGVVHRADADGFDVAPDRGDRVEITTSSGGARRYSPIRDTIFVVLGAGALAVAGLARLLRRRGRPEIAALLDRGDPGPNSPAPAAPPGAAGGDLDRPLSQPERWHRYVAEVNAVVEASRRRRPRG